MVLKATLPLGWDLFLAGCFLTQRIWRGCVLATLVNHDESLLSMIDHDWSMLAINSASLIISHSWPFNKDQKSFNGNWPLIHPHLSLKLAIIDHEIKGIMNPQNRHCWPLIQHHESWRRYDWPLICAGSEHHFLTVRRGNVACHVSPFPQAWTAKLMVIPWWLMVVSNQQQWVVCTYQRLMFLRMGAVAFVIR